MDEKWTPVVIQTVCTLATGFIAWVLTRLLRQHDKTAEDLQGLRIKTLEEIGELRIELAEIRGTMRLHGLTPHPSDRPRKTGA